MKVYNHLFILVAICSFANAQGTWTQKANLTANARYGATGFSIGTKGYIGAGWNSTLYFQDLWEYTPDTLILLGSQKPYEHSTLSAYPNPSDGQFLLQTQFKVSLLNVFSVNGEIILRKSLGEGENIIDLSGMPAGVYFFRVNSGEGTLEVIKVILR